MYNLLQKQSWTELNTIKDVDTAAERFQKVTNTVISQTVPIKIIFNKKAGYTVWFNKEIIKNLKQKDALGKNFKKQMTRASTINTEKYGGKVNKISV